MYDSHYTVAILEVHNGILEPASSKCSNPAPNSSFAGGATTVRNHSNPVNAFWILTGYAFAISPSPAGCGFSTATVPDAYTWGRFQGSSFVSWAKNTPGYSGPIDLMAGDVESFGDDTLWETPSSPNYTWNIQVIKGFVDYVKAYHPTHPGDPNSVGVYTNTPGWHNIMGYASASDIDGNAFWYSYWGAGISTLQGGVQYLKNAGYLVWSWQYGCNTPVDICCSTASASDCAASPPTGTWCNGLSYNAALNESVAAEVPRFDVWTNSAPDRLCPTAAP